MEGEKNKSRFKFVLVRTICDFCNTYGRCAVAIGFDRRELHVGVDCGCLKKGLDEQHKLKQEGSPYIPYC